MVDFEASERGGVYKSIYTRRDIRRFSPRLVPDEKLTRVLNAAHHASSVGFSQPWDFVVIRDDETQSEVAAIAEQAISAAQEGYREPKNPILGN